MISIRCFDQIQVFLRESNTSCKRGLRERSSTGKKYDWENLGAYIVRSYLLLSRKPHHYSFKIYTLLTHI
jgi:hypothetical protein